MKNYQEALDDLEFKAIQYENTLKGNEWNGCAAEVQTDVKTLQELIDRETPKKPKGISVTFDGRVGNCPNCNKFVTDEQSRCNCDQRLDWSKKE